MACLVHWSLTAVACGCMLLAGCEATAPAIWVTNDNGVQPLPEEILIAADPTPLTLEQFEVSSDNRSRLENERSERIAKDAKTMLPSPEMALTAPLVAPVYNPIGVVCYVPPIYVVCVGAIAGVGGIMYAAKRGWDSAVTPHVMPVELAARYSALFREHATGAALADLVVRASSDKHNLSTGTSFDGYPKLVVGVKSARLLSYETAFESAHKKSPAATTAASFLFFGFGGFLVPVVGGSRSMHVSISASAKVFLAAELDPIETVHGADFVLSANDGKLIQGLHDALDSLALSIAVTYFAHSPAAIEFREWQDLRLSEDTAALDAFVRRHPNGNLNEAARTRIRALEFIARTGAGAARKR